MAGGSSYRTWKRHPGSLHILIFNCFMVLLMLHVNTHWTVLLILQFILILYFSPCSLPHVALPEVFRFCSPASQVPLFKQFWGLFGKRIWTPIQDFFFFFFFLSYLRLVHQQLSSPYQTLKNPLVIGRPGQKRQCTYCSCHRHAPFRSLLTECSLFKSVNQPNLQLLATEIHILLH